MRFGSALIVALCAVASTARAQDATPRVEVGPNVSLFGVPYWPIDGGGGAHITVSLTPLIAIETRVEAFRKEPFPSLERGGRTLQFFSGARATFVSRGPVTVYGALMPGLIHYSAVVTSIGRQQFTTGPATHFAIDMGVGASIRLHDRWSASADLSGPLYAVRGSAHLDDFPPAAARGIMVVDVAASVQSTSQFTAGVSYRTGRLARLIKPTHAGAWMVGGDVGVAAYAPLIAVAADVIKASRIGAFLSFPITTWIDADVGANVYLHTDNSHSTYEGGRISQVLAGLKVGRRAGRFGFFGKIRPGVQSYSQGLVKAADFNQPPPFPRPVYGRRYRPVMDVGAVIEAAVSPRFVWRMDVSDLITFYPAKQVTIGETPFADGPYPASSTMMVTTGLAWRFKR